MWLYIYHANITVKKSDISFIVIVTGIDNNANKKGGTVMKNKDIRTAIEKAGVKHYEVASILSIHETTFTRWLRTELSTERKEMVFEAIKAAKNEKGE